MITSAERWRQLNKAPSKTAKVIQQQVAAIGSELFEVGLHKLNAGAGEPVMISRVWDAGTIVKSVPWLRYQNSAGRNIYIRPKGEHDLSMVDDLTRDAVSSKKAGFQSRCHRGNVSGKLPSLAKAPRTTQQGSEHSSRAGVGGEIWW